MKKLSWFLIAAGILIILTPVVGQIITSYNENKLISDWENSTVDTEAPTPTPSVNDSYVRLQDIFAAENQPEEKVITASATPAPKPTKAPLPPQKVLGIIKIAKIKISIPIVEGVNSDNLRAGIGHIPGTAGLGEVGNSALAGHRSYTFGHYFNRLDELDIGDTILIKTKKSEYTYTIYEKLVVLPEDVSVLKKSGDDSIITLITCTPVHVATHRLIIHAVLTPN